MKAKKGLAIAMAALLSLTALAGCSGGAKEAPADQQKAADTAAGDTRRSSLIMRQPTQTHPGRRKQ